MKNLCIVSALGHYQNALKYMRDKNSNDENYLTIFMYSGGVVAEKILSNGDALFWDKVFVFEPEKNATSGMNTVKLNETIEKFEEFLKENNLVGIDQLILGVMPFLPMYNYIPSCFDENTKINVIEDGTATYMLDDKKLFEYMVAPPVSSISSNINYIKKRINRRENGIMLMNTLIYFFTKSTFFSKVQLKRKWKNYFHFQKLIVNNPDFYQQSDFVTFEEVEQYNFGSFLEIEDVKISMSSLPIYFDQDFGIEAKRHVLILDNIFANREIKEIIIKLHPKSRSEYVKAFFATNLKTKFNVELREISGEELLKESCPKEIFGLNSTVLLNSKYVTKINFILNEYLDLLEDKEIELNYFRLMFMNHSSRNLENIFSKETGKIKKLKYSRRAILSQLCNQDSKALYSEIDGKKLTPYMKKVRRGVDNYLFDTNKTRVDDKKIFFEAYKGMYACSPKELFKHFIENPEYDEYQFVWSRSVSMDIESFLELNDFSQVKIVDYASDEYFQELASSKLIITNQRLHIKFEKREGQYVLQTWHGTPFKKDALSVSLSTHNVNHERRVEVNDHDVKNYDYLLVQNEFSAIELSKTFMLDRHPYVEVLKTGYPRNKRLYNEYNQKNIEDLKDKYNIPKNKKVLFYAPTWRDHHKKNKAGINDIFDFDFWRKRLSDEWVVLFRGHYFHSRAVDFERYKGFIFDTTKYNDINDFYLISDLLVTDYSSSYFDYLILKKPIIFYMPDFVAYIKLSRKLHFEPEIDLPGPVAYFADTYIDMVLDYRNVTAPYLEKFDNFITEFCPWDKNANENVIKALKDKKVLH